MYKKALFILFLFSNVLIAADSILEIAYEERIPYVKKENNSLTGLVATPAIKALNEAKISYVLKEKPSKRHLFEIKANVNKICALGWFKNKEREKYAKYTLPLYQDKPFGIIAKKEKNIELENINIDKLLNNKKYTVLTKASYSYGNFLDKKIENYKIKKSEVYSNNEKMLTLIERGRADFMFISKEEATLLLKKNNYKNLLFYKIEGIPKGNKRYLICSKKVPDELIEKINLYIKRSK
ncbi:transporter substrate-binding domain-containing protein [Halarcobacter anaerophilus]|uniref:Uncharacterized protein n=1 Tax=Halarcobacter anaerophilus TaxID=877500 RepID=A0A4Q0XW13_9BACT|nr:transporter substrate-binding domain-containing protein [Halarcobacter anaerophilus]RXJ61632.1 hypothetical protein CRV06_12550 [Halarcobacter anaerophilus]